MDRFWRGLSIALGALIAAGCLVRTKYGIDTGGDTGAETGFYAEDLVTEPTIQAPAVPPAPAPAEAEPAQPG